MTAHRFKIGSFVSLNVSGLSLPKPGRYIVEAQMPPVGTSLQYRIKSEAEGFRRVVVEDQLSSVGATGPAPEHRSLKGEED